jgi:hypothetical protein
LKVFLTTPTRVTYSLQSLCSLLTALLFIAASVANAAVVVNESSLTTDTYTVFADGQVTITITGADGGNGSNTNGGSGATVEGIFDVTAGQVIRYVVGQASVSVASSAGGGGSTGVYIDATRILVAGGGGGGDNSASPAADGLGGNSGEDGDAGTGTGPGDAGTGGNGGGGNANDSAGGGGILSAGADGLADGGGQADTTTADPTVLLSIAAGGAGAGSGTAGGSGYSGGGGADFQYSGGAGGYSGGGAAGANGAAGGGGSFVNTGASGYVSSSFIAGVDGGGNEADGSIIVDFVEAAPVPGINPLPPSDSNSAPMICSASGDEDPAVSSGTVNSYYPATASVAAAATSISLGARIGSATAITAGDLVMVIQMQDALIDTSNSLDYGDGSAEGTNDASGSTDIRQTGLYEFAIVESFVGTTLTLSAGLTHAYNDGTNQRFQVIRVPRYNNLTLTGDLDSAEWDGSAGGVVVIDVLDTLDFDGNTINVSAIGFRGGIYVGGDSTGQSVVGPDYRTVPANDPTDDTDVYAEKGEGIAGTSAISQVGDGYPSGDLARGAPGNAGGGGNDHNGGGGGGSNIGHGGQGGDGWSAGVDAGGSGGGLFDGYSGRLLLGGGGGAGNANNSSTAGSGGGGGGLVFINVTTISGTGTIDASGVTGFDSNLGFTSGNDGAGGGGGGGTIVIRTASATVSGLTLNVAGGKGGDVITPDPHGPGGGGGAIYIDATGATINTAGGVAGIFYATATQTKVNPQGSHGAQPGQDGNSSPITDIPVPMACDYPDEDGYNSASTVHQIDAAGGENTGLTIGSIVDFESADLGMDTEGDDDNDSSGNAAGDDEDGVSFSLVASDKSMIEATVSYNNPAGGSANLCGWMDASNNGAYETGEGSCVTVAAGSGSQVFTFSGLPTSASYDVYSRFRITTDAITTATPSGTATDGEAEAYKINVNPTAVTIGTVELTATRVDDFLNGINHKQMDRAELLALLAVWDSAAAAAEENADSKTILQALRDFLDPDGDGQLALLAWDTLEQRGTIGFYVERQDADNNRWIKINQKMLPALVMAPLGGEYRLADPSVQTGQRYNYQLIELESSGSTNTYGPFAVEIKP